MPDEGKKAVPPAGAEGSGLEASPDIVEADHERPEPAASSVGFSSRQLRRVRELLARFYGVRRAVRFYPSGHPAVEEGMKELMDVIGLYHAEGVDVPLAFFEDELLLGDQFLPEDSLLYDQLIRDMTSIGAGSVTFTQGLDANELHRALEVLATDETELAAEGGLREALARIDLPHVLVGEVTVVEAAKSDEEGEEPARRVYMSALDLLRELDNVIRSGERLLPGQTKTVVRSLVDNVVTNRFAMLELSGLKDYDEYTFYHSVNVAILSLAVGGAITEDRRFLTSLGAGALMHDIGKMSVATPVLNKPGPLTTEEWAEMRLHPIFGAEVAATMPGLDRASIVVILEHHMRLDLDGYPRCTLGRTQHLASRIVAVADAFDAMTSRRAYSSARLPDQAMGILAENAGSAFDDRLVRLFIRMMGIYPPRTVVRLSTGEIGIVVRPPENDLARPIVKVIAHPDGTAADPFDVDLADTNERSIIECLDPAGLNVDVDDYL